MKTEITKDGLLLITEPDDIKELQELKEYYEDKFDSDGVIMEFMESFICNSEYDFIDASEIGALTCAPIIATKNSDNDVVDAFAFMDYQAISLQSKLLEDGQAFLQRG